MTRELEDDVGEERPSFPQNTLVNLRAELDAERDRLFGLFASCRELLPFATDEEKVNLHELSVRLLRSLDNLLVDRKNCQNCLFNTLNVSLESVLVCDKHAEDSEKKALAGDRVMFR